MTYRALGVHVFAGGFSRGIQLHGDWEVMGQLEIHDLGSLTVRQKLGIPVIQTPHFSDWPINDFMHFDGARRYVKDCDMIYGNPRCTGFSCVTAGLGSKAHGPWSNQTRDARDLIEYGVGIRPPVIVWESVQQAYSVGKPLLNHMRDEYLVPNGYKIAHIFVTAAAFQNAQNRKRYFMLAYQGDKNFNVTPPDLDHYRTTVRDVIGHLEDTPTTTWRWGEPYTDDSHFRIDDELMEVLPHMPRGWDLNAVARHRYDLCPPGVRKRWDQRGSDIPFSMHCIKRLGYDVFAPTLFGGLHNLVHPTLNRTLTIRELSLLMGFDFTPVGEHGPGQIAKGIVPAVGTWIAEQVRLYLEDAWGSVDFASRYDAKIGTFVDAPKTDTEKVFDLTNYRPYRDRAWEAQCAELESVR